MIGKSNGRMAGIGRLRGLVVLLGLLLLGAVDLAPPGTVAVGDPGSFSRQGLGGPSQIVTREAMIRSSPVALGGFRAIQEYDIAAGEEE